MNNEANRFFDEADLVSWTTMSLIEAYASLDAKEALASSHECPNPEWIPYSWLEFDGYNILIDWDLPEEHTEDFEEGAAFYEWAYHYIGDELQRRALELAKLKLPATGG